MGKLETIEKFVTELSAEELHAFRAWFEEFQEQRFDEQIERDAKAGKLDTLMKKALDDHRAGRTTLL
jgi:hypothetical protein